MSQQTMRQRARRDVRSVTSKRRAALLKRAKRLEDLAVLVMTAVGERDAAVAEAERRAGAALREMTRVEGVTLREAVEWCGDQIGVREATRLRRLSENGQEVEEGDEDGASAVAATGVTAEGGERVPVPRLDDAGLAAVAAALADPRCSRATGPRWRRCRGVSACGGPARLRAGLSASVRTGAVMAVSGMRRGV